MSILVYLFSGLVVLALIAQAKREVVDRFDIEGFENEVPPNQPEIDKVKAGRKIERIQSLLVAGLSIVAGVFSNFFWPSGWWLLLTVPLLVLFVFVSVWVVIMPDRMAFMRTWLRRRARRWIRIRRAYLWPVMLCVALVLSLVLAASVSAFTDGNTDGHDATSRNGTEATKAEKPLTSWADAFTSPGRALEAAKCLGMNASELGASVYYAGGEKKVFVIRVGGFKGNPPAGVPAGATVVQTLEVPAAWLFSDEGECNRTKLPPGAYVLWPGVTGGKLMDYAGLFSSGRAVTTTEQPLR